MKAAFLGVWPSADHNGNPFPKTSPRSKLAGQPLAGPWRLAFSEIRGDEEFMAWVLISFVDRPQRSTRPTLEFDPT